MFKGLKRTLGLPLVLVVVFFGLALLFDSCSSDSDEQTEAPPATKSLNVDSLSSLDDFAHISLVGLPSLDTPTTNA